MSNFGQFLQNLSISSSGVILAASFIFSSTIFVWSALILFYKGDFKGRKIDLKDNQKVLEFFKRTYKKYTDHKMDTNKFGRLVLANSFIWGEDFTALDKLVENVSKNIVAIENYGVLLAIQQIGKDDK